MVGSVKVACTIKKRNSSEKAEMVLINHPYHWRRDFQGMVLVSLSTMQYLAFSSGYLSDKYPSAST